MSLSRAFAFSIVAFSAELAHAQAIHDPHDIVAALTGEAEIQPGVSLADRQSVAGRSAARAYLSTLLSELGVEPQTHTYRANGANVFGTLASTTGGTQSIVLGAHFDSVRRSPGANDNATGVALIDAVVDAMAQATCRSRNLVVVFFDEEELGLVGSKAFARWLLDARSDVHSVHTVDQMGWDADGDRAVEIEQPSATMRALYQRVAREVGVTAHVTSTGSTDHEAFRDLGFEAVGLTEEYVNGDTTPYYHSPGDTYDTVNFDYLASSSTYMTEVVRDLLTEGCR